MPNHLINENSPYLLQHSNNLVDWYPWGEEALSKARMENKPIFLSIGYAACHWCHVMAHESLEDPEVAAFMNEYYDWGYGGWGSAPKFPQPMTVEFLLRRATKDITKNETTNSAIDHLEIKPAFHALKAMARGGMYDAVGGGFSRYSTDNFWRVPHFEKMLYDNAQLARAYLHAWQITGDPFFKQIVIETINFIEREMTHSAGGFYSSLDADSEGEEGKFYVWTLDEIRATLKDNSDFFEAAYGVTIQGNWEGRTVLQRALDDASLAARFKI